MRALVWAVPLIVCIGVILGVLPAWMVTFGIPFWLWMTIFTALMVTWFVRGFRAGRKESQ